MRMAEAHSPTRPPVFSARQWSVGYGPRAILDALDFDLEAGKTHVFTGPGGSGKSVLLKGLAGLASNGSGFWTRGELRRARALCSYLPQKLMAGEMPVRQLLEQAAGGERDMAGRLRQTWECAPSAADCLVSALDYPVSRFPRGLVRVAHFTAAVLSPADVVMLDEPEAGAGAAGFEWMARFLRRQRGQRTFVIVCHHLALIREVADTVTLMVDGRIVESAATPRFFEQPRLERTRTFIRVGA